MVRLQRPLAYVAMFIVFLSGLIIFIGGLQFQAELVDVFVDGTAVTARLSAWHYIAASLSLVVALFLSIRWRSVV